MSKNYDRTQKNEQKKIELWMWYWNGYDGTFLLFGSNEDNRHYNSKFLSIALADGKDKRKPNQFHRAHSNKKVKKGTKWEQLQSINSMTFIY